MTEIVKIGKVDIVGAYRVAKILNECGRDMGDKLDLHHWDNPFFNSLLISIICSLRNDVYIVYKDHKPIATFQMQKQGEILHFEKLATIPSEAGKGVGSLCLKKTEEIANAWQCKYIRLEVYEKSKHAISLYEKMGYIAIGEFQSLKYNEIIMQKVCN